MFTTLAMLACIIRYGVVASICRFHTSGADKTRVQFPVTECQVFSFLRWHKPSAVGRNLDKAMTGTFLVAVTELKGEPAVREAEGTYDGVIASESCTIWYTLESIYSLLIVRIVLSESSLIILLMVIRVHKG
jgi:hypothetical protein